MTTALAAPDRPWSPDEFEARLRGVAQERYHDRHPFNVRMHEGDLTPKEVRRWIANRFHYQRHIPVKDALITAKLDSPRLRRMWLRRIEDHDGRSEGEGGIERWLRLGEAAGLDRGRLLTGDRVLPGVRLAVEGYVNFCRLRPPLEAVAASLTELTAPGLMRRRIDAFERHYAWIEPAGLDYFRTRVDQGRRDSTEALALVLKWARTRDDQRRAVAALTFKCDVLWSLLDAVQQDGAEAGAGEENRARQRDRADAPEPVIPEELDSRPWRNVRPTGDGRPEPGYRPEPDSRPWRPGPRVGDGLAEPGGSPELDSRPWRPGPRVGDGLGEPGGSPELDSRPWRPGRPAGDGRPEPGYQTESEGRPELDSRPWRNGRPTPDSPPARDSRPWRNGRPMPDSAPARDGRPWRDSGQEQM